MKFKTKNVYTLEEFKNAVESGELGSECPIEKFDEFLEEYKHETYTKDSDGDLIGRMFITLPDAEVALDTISVYDDEENEITTVLIDSFEVLEG